MSGIGLGAGDPAQCPCGTGLPYAGCCGPLLTGERTAATAQALMRSRYTAFATGDEAYLVRTWHPRTRPERVGLDPATRWTGLTVLRTERGGTTDDEGVVEFVATWLEQSADRAPLGRDGRAPRTGRGRDAQGELHEVSRFARRAGRWLYLDGEHR